MINDTRLLETFLELVRISSPSGQETPVARVIAAHLQRLGIASSTDAAGNLLAAVTGQGDPLLLTAHMDTVTPCASVHPVVREGIIYSDGTTILGADDKSGVAAILELLEALAERHLPHRPLELAFTVREEVGLCGAKALDVSRLDSKMAIGLDAGGTIGTIVCSAPSQDSLSVMVHGRAAHAGVSPEKGINAIRIAAEAIVAMPLGRIDAETTANIGIIQGGAATNIIPDLVTLKGEARSRVSEKLDQQTARMVDALQRAAQAGGATVEITVQREYSAYTYNENSPIVELVSRGMRSLDIEPLLMPTGGGSDANILNAAGIATVEISTGMSNVHTVHEQIALADISAAARVLVACVTL
ncbi:MAG: M20/M25/M40 family metallo-hydrolase [Anaerolineae bacterium]